VFLFYSLMKNNDDPGVFNISLARDMYEYILGALVQDF
jgi:hypothetical protein